MRLRLIRYNDRIMR